MSECEDETINFWSAVADVIYVNFVDKHVVWIQVRESNIKSIFIEVHNPHIHVHVYFQAHFVGDMFNLDFSFQTKLNPTIHALKNCHSQRLRHRFKWS